MSNLGSSASTDAVGVSDEVLLEDVLNRMPITVRAHHVIVNTGLRTVGELRALGLRGLRRQPNCGSKTIKEIDYTIGGGILSDGSAAARINQLQTELEVAVRQRDQAIHRLRETKEALGRFVEALSTSNRPLMSIASNFFEISVDNHGT